MSNGKILAWDRGGGGGGSTYLREASQILVEKKGKRAPMAPMAILQ